MGRESQNRRIAQARNDLKDHPAPAPCYGHGHLPLDQASKSPIQCPEHLQGWGMHSWAAPHHPHSEEFLISKLNLLVSSLKAIIPCDVFTLPDRRPWQRTLIGNSWEATDSLKSFYFYLIWVSFQHWHHLSLKATHFIFCSCRKLCLIVNRDTKTVFSLCTNRSVSPLKGLKETRKQSHTN